MTDKNHTQFSSLFSYNLNPLITMHWYNSGFLWLWKGRKYGKFHKTWVTCFDYLNKGQYALFTNQSEKAKAITTWLRRVCRTWQPLQVFPRLAAVTFFSRPWHQWHAFPRRHWLHIFPRSALVSCLPSLGTSHMFFLGVLIVFLSFFCLLWLARCDYSAYLPDLRWAFSRIFPSRSSLVTLSVAQKKKQITKDAYERCP